MVLLFAVVINKGLGKERTKDCIFVLSYLFNMSPEKCESFNLLSKMLGTCPQSPLALI